MVQAMVPTRGVCGRSMIPFDYLSHKVVGNMPQLNPMLNAPRDSVEFIRGNDEPQEALFHYKRFLELGGPDPDEAIKKRIEQLEDA